MLNVLPVGVSVTTTILVFSEPEIVATVPTPVMVCFAVVVLTIHLDIHSVCPHAVERPVVVSVETPVTVAVTVLYPASLPYLRYILVMLLWW